MTSSLLTALAAVAIAPGTVATPPTLAPARKALDGPLAFCAEAFSIRLERGERVEWDTASTASPTFTIKSGGDSASAFRLRDDSGPRPPREMAPVGLPLSPVAWRVASPMPALTMTDEQGRERQLVTYIIVYYLHGEAETRTPLQLVGFDEDRDAAFPFLERVDPRPLAARGCAPSPTDPALAGRIVDIPGGR